MAVREISLQNSKAKHLYPRHHSCKFTKNLTKTVSCRCRVELAGRYMDDLFQLDVFQLDVFQMMGTSLVMFWITLSRNSSEKTIRYSLSDVHRIKSS